MYVACGGFKNSGEPLLNENKWCGAEETLGATQVGVGTHLKTGLVL